MTIDWPFLAGFMSCWLAVGIGVALGAGSVIHHVNPINDDEYDFPDFACDCAGTLPDDYYGE